MQRFRLGNLQMLIATDVAARGLDVKELTHVINYSLPDDPEVYVHRSGRTGRAGKKGLSLTIAHSREMSKIKALEKMVQKTFTKEMVPAGSAIVEKRLYNLIDKIKQTEVNEEQIEPFLTEIFSKFEEVTKEELIKKFVSVEFTRFLEYYKGARDINMQVSDRSSRDRDRGKGDSDGEGKGKGRRERDTKFSRFYINLGTKSDVNAAVLIGVINDNTRTRNIEIGKIELMKRFSFFEVDKQYEKEIIEGFKNAKFRGEEINVEISNAKPVTQNDGDGYGKRRDRSGDRSTSKRSDRSSSSSSSKRKSRPFEQKNKGKRR
jgi:ATP-dependent RNA helicase DeaD